MRLEMTAGKLYRLIGRLVVLGAVLSASSLFMGATITSTKTAQGIMVDLQASGTFTSVDRKTYRFNVDDPSQTDANGVMLPAASYFTNTLASGPTVSCSGSLTNCASSNQPGTPVALTPSLSQVTGPSGACHRQRCTFLDGGKLTGFTYTQSKTVSGRNGKGSWIFTWTYTVAPEPSKDVDPSTDGVQVNPFTAWVLTSEDANLAHVPIGAKIAGESVVQSSNSKVGTKYSFSLRNSDGTSRVTNLKLWLNEVQVASPSSTISENCPGCLPGAPGAVDFTYFTNAGSKGTTSLLKNGDARSILNSDSFKGNDDGGADGTALAVALMTPVYLDLAAGSYTVTVTGTVKGNTGQVDISFTVKQNLIIITPGCGK
ncbi:MAG: hypothetical protein HYU29_08415 [Chloroflexi bacterium]|nr:hypothetical protein [Chloroflexota bacterium]